MNYAEAVLKVLKGRGGFDGWWDEIDEETQEEIKLELRQAIHQAQAPQPATDSGSLFVCKGCFNPELHAIASESYPGTCSICGQNRPVVSCYLFKLEDLDDAFQYGSVEPVEDYDYTADDRNFDMYNGR